MELEQLAARLARLTGVVAVTLGGSRARGTERPESDWDLGLYYRGSIDPAELRALGYPGHVVAPGSWGRLVNGGGWLSVDGEQMDVLYRDLDFVLGRLAEVEQGQFEVDNVAGSIAGLPTYTLVGELALGRVLHGSLPRPEFPAALRHTAPPWWEGGAAFALYCADVYATCGETVLCAGVLARAVVCLGHVRLAARGEWVLNEKEIVRRADLEPANAILAEPGSSPAALTRPVEAMRRLLGLGRSAGRQADAVVRL